MILRRKLNIEKLEELGYKRTNNLNWSKRVYYYDTDWDFLIYTEYGKPEKMKGYSLHQAEPEISDNLFQLLSFNGRKQIRDFQNELEEMWSEFEKDVEKVIEND